MNNADYVRPCDGGCGDESVHDAHLTAAGEARYSIAPTKFESVPVEIESICWVGGVEAAIGIINWILENGGTARYHSEQVRPVRVTAAISDGATLPPPEIEPEGIFIDTIEGTMKTSAGDWIIRGTEGEFYPCKDSVFQRKYKPLTIKEKN